MKIPRDVSVDKFEEELQHLLNRHSMENYCDVPDYILAQMVTSFIIETGHHIKRTLTWHGCDSVCHPKDTATNEGGE